MWLAVLILGVLAGLIANVLYDRYLRDQIVKM